MCTVQQKPESALILGDYKLLYHWESQSAQLFDLRKDLLESTDLSKELPEGTAKLASANPDYDPNATPPRRQRQ